MSQLRCSFFCVAIIDSIYFDETKHAYLKKLPQLTGVHDGLCCDRAGIIISVMFGNVDLLCGR